MALKKEQSANACRLKTSIGGQALMEGIMMRGPKNVAMAVRNQKGEIIVEEVETKASKRPAFCRWPIIRGLFGYIDSMVLGYKCLMRSAEIAALDTLAEENETEKNETEAETLRAEETAAPANEIPAEPAAQTETEPDAKADEPDAKADEPDAKADEPDAKTDEPAEKEKKEEKKEDGELPGWLMPLITVISLVLGFGLAIFLFVFVPTWVFEALSRRPFPWLRDHGAAADSLIKSVFEGVLKILILIAYMGAISLMKDIRRTFMYHGAEHKTIFCYEAGLELTVENVRKQRRFHPRCGTSFLILMLLVSIFLSFFIDPISIAISGQDLPILWRVLVKLLLIPLIVGFGYELIKFAGRHDNWLTRVISAPGVWLQHITVFEPTDDMIECAIAAVTPVIPDDGSDKW